ncbi:MAG: HAMP domain-containing histidine kinase [Clostridia bacterium]|nr:HAMP domain-containing histidine kinase [Clostridia bacterium]
MSNKKRYRTLRNKASVLILLIITLSALLTGAMLVVLFRVGLIPERFSATAWMLPITVVVSCILGAILAALAMRIFVKPLDELVAATKKIAEGDFSARVDEKVLVSEIGTLVENFNKMAKELEGTEIFRSDFINNFSHEFKTPIVSIRGFARQLSEKELTEEERKLYTDIILSESERLASMAGNVLLLSKLENQQLIPDKKAYSLDEQIRKCILIFAKEWEKKNIELDIDLDEIIYIGNEEIMSHVWINLLGNAIKYTAEGGKISVRAVCKAKDIVVRISDSGMGMTKDVMERIFDKFYQGDNSHSGNGNGLGLPLVKRIIQLCEGRIVVDSEAGAGTVFFVYLPI